MLKRINTIDKEVRFDAIGKTRVNTNKKKIIKSNTEIRTEEEQDLDLLRKQTQKIEDQKFLFIFFRICLGRGLCEEYY